MKKLILLIFSTKLTLKFLSDEIKQGVADVLSDTSAALEVLAKSKIEIDSYVKDPG